MNKPFLLSPAAKDYLWGGNRLNNEFNKGINMYPLAETWECSTHPDGLSIVASGEFKGQTLLNVLNTHPEFLGSHPKSKGELPILVKFIDAKKDLSVQVHPNDAYAKKYENGQNGKTEMWYVLDAAKDSTLVYGLKRDMNRDDIKDAILDGSIEKYMNKVPIHKNDLFFIEAGTIHAIGAGALVAEIQENSNLTYRMYDYNRVDKNGHKRPLHIDKALDVANLNGMGEPRQPIRILRYNNGWASELLCRCKYFEVLRVLVDTEQTKKFAEYKADRQSFRVLLCIDGCGTLLFDDEVLYIYKGDCIFVPANSVLIKAHGKMKFLNIRG